MERFEMYGTSAKPVVVPPDGMEFSKITFDSDGLPVYGKDDSDMKSPRLEYTQAIQVFFTKISHAFDRVVVQDGPIFANTILWFAPPKSAKGWNEIWIKFHVFPTDRWEKTPVQYTNGSRYYRNLKWVSDLIQIAPTPERIPIPNSLYYSLNILDSDTPETNRQWNDWNSLLGYGDRTLLNASNPAVEANGRIVHIARKYANGIGIAVLHKAIPRVVRDTPTEVEYPRETSTNSIPVFALLKRSDLYRREAREKRQIYSFDDESNDGNDKISKKDSEFIPSDNEEEEEEDPDEYSDEEKDEELEEGYEKVDRKIIHYDSPITISMFEFIPLDIYSTYTYVGTQRVDGDAFLFLYSLAAQFKQRLNYSDGSRSIQFLTFDSNLMATKAPEVVVLASEKYSKPTLGLSAWKFWYIASVLNLCIPIEASIKTFQSNLNVHRSEKQVSSVPAK
jgi:hypothetical protein